MDKRGKKYTDEFKMLILELLEEERKKILESEYVHNEKFKNLESLRAKMYEYIDDGIIIPECIAR